MEEIQLRPQNASVAAYLCQHCGRGMRLIGSEPHPVKDDTDLLTYFCKACDDFLVLPFASGENT